MKLAFTILGEPASKANSREISHIGAKKMDVVVGREADGSPKLERMKVGGRIMNRKSDKALAYEADCLRQVPPRMRLRLEGSIRITIRIYYANRRSDLDESVILDCLQDRYKKVDGEVRMLVQRGVYRNDRQIDEKHIYRSYDARNPRAEIEIEEISPQQQALDLPADPEPVVAAPVPAIAPPKFSSRRVRERITMFGPDPF